MARYAPALSPLVLKALHYEARRQGIPMTRLADLCVSRMLQGTPGWKQAERELEELRRDQSRIFTDPQ